jgi:hypothetical protein
MPWASFDKRIHCAKQKTHLECVQLAFDHIRLELGREKPKLAI